MSALPSNEYAALDGILQRHRHDPTRLLQILIEAQDIAGWLPADTPLIKWGVAMDKLADALGGGEWWYRMPAGQPGRYEVEVNP